MIYGQHVQIVQVDILPTPPICAHSHFQQEFTVYFIPYVHSYITPVCIIPNASRGFAARRGNQPLWSRVIQEWPHVLSCRSFAVAKCRVVSIRVYRLLEAFVSIYSCSCQFVFVSPLFVFVLIFSYTATNAFCFFYKKKNFLWKNMVLKSWMGGF